MVGVLNTLKNILEKNPSSDEDFQHTMAVKQAFMVLEQALLPKYKELYRKTMVKVLDEMIRLTKGGMNAQGPSLN